MEEKDLLDYTDSESVRKAVFNRAQEAVESGFPVANDRHGIRVTDVKYDGPETFSKADQKRAILENRSLSRKLTGTWQTYDSVTGKPLGTGKRTTIMNVPWLTERGTFIRNGTEYVVAKQLRMDSSAYTRRTDDGMVETQFNVKPRTGTNFRLFMDPKTSAFYMRHKGRKTALYPVLKAMGVSDEDISKSWGKEILDANRPFSKNPHARNWLSQFAQDPHMSKTAADSPAGGTLHRPENWDVYEEYAEPRRHVMFSGADDWETSPSMAWVECDGNGSTYRVWVEISLPKGVESNDTDTDKAEYDVIKKHGKSFISKWHDQALQLYGDKEGPAGSNLAQAYARALEDKELEEYVDHAGVQVVTWEDSDDLAKEAKEQTKPVLEEKLVQGNTRQNLLSHFTQMQLDEDNTESTLGQRYDRVTPNAMLSATNKIIGVSRGERDTDDRDSLEFQRLHDVSDFIHEAVYNDQGRHAKQLLWRLSGRGQDASKIPPGFLDKHIDSVFGSSLSQAIEEMNPYDTLDQNQRVTRLGPGALPNLDSVPAEARNVQPSYLGYIDPVRSPESLKIGVDLRFARGVRKGRDGRMYTQLHNPRTNRLEWVSSKQAARSTVAFPDAMTSKDRFVPAINGKGINGPFDRKDVDYIVPNGGDMFSIGANMVPSVEGIKGMRLLMGAKQGTQALPLVNREAPLVQTQGMKKSNEDELGQHLGAIRAAQDGVIKQVRKDGIIMQHADGTTSKIDVYDNFPFMRKSSIRNMVNVKAGQRVKKGELLATSNFTDDSGKAALGTNLKVAFLNYHGHNFEDGIVISDVAAKRLTSEHMYHEKLAKSDNTVMDAAKYKALFPGKFNRTQLDTIDEKGMVKPGTVLHDGDPIFLAFKHQPPAEGSAGRRINTDNAVTWNHDYPAVVTDIAKGKRGWKALVRANQPMQVADKLTGRYGNKGVIAKIVPAAKMPKNEAGDPIDVLMSDKGITSRTNSSQVIEVALAKIARKTGKPFVLPAFSEEPLTDMVERELKKNKVKLMETVFDPRLGKSIPKVNVGEMYLYKLHHTADAKGKARSTGTYTAEDQPSKGGPGGAKHLGSMEQQALLAHGATELLKDLKLVKGQRNDDFWRDLKLGRTPTMPKTPFVYDKFRHMMRAAGINMEETKDSDNIFAMTNEQVNKLTGNRQVKSGKTLTATDMKPIAGGLFDKDIMGSNGTNWSYIQLPEPMLNPVMEAPVRSILGMTKKQLNALMSGEEAYDGKIGGEALKLRLSRVDIPLEKKRTLDVIRSGAKTKRDAAVKKYQYLAALEKQGTEPTSFMWDRVPVLPAKFRPVTRHDGLTMVADPNYLYSSLLDVSNDFTEAKTAGLSAQDLQESRTDMNTALGALIGTTDPVKEKLQQKNVKGIIQQITGKGSPKAGFIQRRVIGTNTDMAGLGVVTPNPSLKLNQVGLPEKHAWKLYEPYIIRRLVQNGYSATDAAKAVADKAPSAYTQLQKEVQVRPVVFNRAPTLHKYSMLGAFPVLTKGNTLQVSPAVVGPMGMDFDGDTASMTVPTTDGAVRDVLEKMMPDKLLRSERHRKPHFLPANEYIHGSWLATKKANRRGVKTFATAADAEKAYRKGEIEIDDPIVIKEK